MGVLTPKQVLERAKELDDEKLGKLLEDIPKEYLRRICVLAMSDNLNTTNPELYDKIQKAGRNRLK